MKQWKDEQGNIWIGDTEDTAVPSDEYAARMTAQDMNPLESFLVGAGRTFNNIGENLGLMDEQPGGTQAMQALRQENPWSTAAGEIAPYFAPIPGGAAAQIAGGAGMGWLGANSDEGLQTEQAVLGGIGGGIGHIAGRVIDRVIGAKSAKNYPFMRQDARTAAGAGDTSISPGEAWGSEWMKSLEAGFESVPGGKTIAGKTGRQKNVNEKALDVFGLGGQHKTISDAATDDILDVIDADFRAVESALPQVTVPAYLADDIRNVAGITGDFKKVHNAKTGTVLGEKGDDMVLSNDSLMSLRSRMLRKNKNPNDLSVERGEAIDALDSVVEAVVPDQVMKDWAKARGEYRFYKSMEKSLNGQNVSAPKLANQLREWTDATGPVKTARDYSRSLRSSDFTRPFGEPGTTNQAMALASAGTGGALPLAAGLLHGGYRSLFDLGTANTAGMAAAGRGGLLGAPDYIALRDQNR